MEARQQLLHGFGHERSQVQIHFFSNCYTPPISQLSTDGRSENRQWIKPIIDKKAKTIVYEIEEGNDIQKILEMKKAEIKIEEVLLNVFILIARLNQII